MTMICRVLIEWAELLIDYCLSYSQSDKKKTAWWSQHLQTWSTTFFQLFKFFSLFLCKLHCWFLNNCLKQFINIIQIILHIFYSLQLMLAFKIFNRILLSSCFWFCLILILNIIFFSVISLLLLFMFIHLQLMLTC
jgi:hypothetical protein